MAECDFLASAREFGLVRVILFGRGIGRVCYFMAVELAVLWMEMDSLVLWF